MIVRWMRSLQKEWELSVFVTMLLLNICGGLFAMGCVLWPSAPDNTTWVSPKAKLRQMDTDIAHDFNALGSDHAMRVQVPLTYKPYKADVPELPTTRIVSRPTPPPRPTQPSPPHIVPVRSLIYNGIFITPGRTPLALFRETEQRGDAVTYENHFIGDNGTIGNYQVIAINADYVTLVGPDGTSRRLPRATPLRLL